MPFDVEVLLTLVLLAEQSEVPEQYRSSQLSSVSTTPEHEVHDSDQTHCNCQEADFCHWDDENSGEAVYVDLLKNPERFTGYAGSSANRVWKSIYEENCFGAGPFLEPPRSKASGGGSGFPHLGGSNRESKGLSSGSPLALSSLMASLQAPLDPGDSEICLEKRIFYRIISGLHASISIHICADHLDQRTGEWGPNLDCFIARISQHPERLQNVYFNYVLLLRALARAGEGKTGIPALLPGSEVAEAKTQEDLASLLRAANNIPTTFDEHSMFAGPDAYGLKQEFKAKFRNVSSIMDCVGCDKCRLWGKLQTNGLATALKVLFSYEDVQHDSDHPTALQRSELVALLNTAHRFAESVSFYCPVHEACQPLLRISFLTAQSGRDLPHNVPGEDRSRLWRRRKQEGFCAGRPGCAWVFRVYASHCRRSAEDSAPVFQRYRESFQRQRN